MKSCVSTTVYQWRTDLGTVACEFTTVELAQKWMSSHKEAGINMDFYSRLKLVEQTTTTSITPVKF